MEKSSWSVTEGGKCGGLGAVSNLAILNSLILSRGQLEIWDQSQEKDQGQMDESRSHYTEVKAAMLWYTGNAKMWRSRDHTDRQTDRELRKLRLEEGVGRQV